MFINYLKIAFRSLTRQKIYSIINIGGLAVGLAVSMVILTYVVHELSYDRFHTNGERIFRAEKQFARDGRYSLYANPEFGPTLKQTDSHVTNFVRLYEPGRKVVSSGSSNLFFEDRFIFADTSFFSIFSFP
jgi:putative ABC transport system permease protein